MSGYYDIKTLCSTLGVNRSSYYYYLKHTEPNRYQKDNKELDELILKEYHSSGGKYGSPKITRVLKKKEVFVSEKRVARRMKVLGLKSIVVKKYNHNGHKKSKDDGKPRPNLLKQDFKSDKPFRKLVADITYIWTTDMGWTYLATVEDLFERRIVGWHYGITMDENLTIKALDNAVISAKGFDLKNAIFHNDRGTQYTSDNFEARILELGLIHSYSKKAYPYDNAAMESFNSIIKREEINCNPYTTFYETNMRIFKFIEGWYNNIRIHSSIDYLTPNEVFNNYLKNQISQKTAIAL